MPEDFDSKVASEGRLVWQKYNCQSCHQLYGLGGYLGPDLTYIYSAPGKGEIVIKALVKSGTTQMPSFNLTIEEETNLLQFLKSTDASGQADPRKFLVKSNGMIESK
jgi:nitric oxide reductase subunit C